MKILLTTSFPVACSPAQSHGEAFPSPSKSLHQLLEFCQGNSTTLVYEGGIQEALDFQGDFGGSCVI